MAWLAQDSRSEEVVGLQIYCEGRTERDCTYTGREKSEMVFKNCGAKWRPLGSEEGQARPGQVNFDEDGGGT